MRDRGAFHSADTTGGWRNHYARMKRWEIRALELAEHQRNSDIDLADLFDFALAYFVWAHSLLEWIRIDEPELASCVDGATYPHKDWPMCRALANRSRHFDQRRRSSEIDKYWSLKRSYDPFDAQLTSGTGHSAAITYDGKKRSLPSVILSISKMWDDILEEVGLDAKDKWIP